LTSCAVCNSCVHGNIKVTTEEICSKQTGHSQEIVCTVCPGRDGTLLDLAKQQDCASQKAFNFSEKCEPGSYLSLSILTIAGNYISTVRYQNISLPSSPFVVTVVPAAPYALLSTLHSSQQYVATAGANHLFLVSSADVFGNLVASATSGWSFRLDAMSLPSNNPVGFALSNEDPPVDGIFTVRFEFTSAGKYSISIMVLPFLQPIRGSPFDISVKSGVFNATTSYLVGTGISIATAGIDQTFRIISKDRYSNLIHEKIHNVSGDITSNLLLERENITVLAFASETSIGTFIVRYQTTKAGIYRLTASYYGVNLIGVPASVSVVPGTTSAKEVIVYGEGLLSATVDLQSTFQISVADAFGNQRSVGGDIFMIVLSGGWTESADGDQRGIENFTTLSRDNNDGSYLITYLLTRSGVFNVHVSLFEKSFNSTIRNTPVIGSPFLGLMIKPGVLNGRITAVYGLSNSSKAEDPKIAHVQGKDSFGNPTNIEAQMSTRFSTNLQYGVLVKQDPKLEFSQNGSFSVIFPGKCRMI
jgi:hypothetical protein